MKKTLVLVSIAVLGMAACKNGDSQKPTAAELMEKASKAPGANAGENKFEITAPSGWEKKDTNMNGIHITYMLSPSVEKNFRPNINVVTQSMGDNTLQNYFDLNLAHMGEYLQNYSAGKFGDQTVNGLPAKWMTYSHTASGNDLDVLAYIVPKDGIAYIITCSSAKGMLDNNRANFESSVGSFRIQ